MERSSISNESTLAHKVLRLDMGSYTREELGRGQVLTLAIPAGEWTARALWRVDHSDYRACRL